METLTRDQALEQYARNDAEMRRLLREQADLKKIIFSTIIKTNEPEKSPQVATRREGIGQRYKIEIARVLRELGSSATPKEIYELGEFEHTLCSKDNVFYTTLGDLVKSNIINLDKSSHKYSLAIHADNGNR